MLLAVLVSKSTNGENKNFKFDIFTWRFYLIVWHFVLIEFLIKGSRKWEKMTDYLLVSFQRSSKEMLSYCLEGLVILLKSYPTWLKSIHLINRLNCRNKREWNWGKPQEDFVHSMLNALEEGRHPKTLFVCSMLKPIYQWSV